MGRFSDRRFSSPTPFMRTPTMRLTSMIGMLIILGALIVTMRDPAQWRWMVNEKPVQPAAGAANDEPKPEIVHAEYPIAAGPTDLDPEEWKNAQELLDMVEDKKPVDGFLNSAAKVRLLRWVTRQKPEDFIRRPATDVRLQDLLTHPAKYHGKLVRFRIRVKRCLPIPPADGKFPGMHEMLGYSDNTALWLYWLVTPGIPKGFPVGEVIHAETVDVTGYFHTARAFVDGLGKTSLAPEIVGVATWYPAKPQVSTTRPEWLLLALLAAVPLLGYLIWRRFRSIGVAEIALPRTANRNVEDWLANPPPPTVLDELAAEPASAGRHDPQPSDN